MIQMCFTEVDVWSDKDVASLGFSVVKRRCFTLNFYSVLH